MEVKNKKITILGIGKSGVESARFLRSRGAQIFLSENIKNEKTEKTKKLLETEGFDVEIGSHSEEKIKKSVFIVISPGIKPDSSIYRKIISLKIPFYSEIEVASWFLEIPYIAVTGTNGKTTVTTLIAQILSENGIAALSCGNIGNPLIGEIDRVNHGKLIPVIEVSSFQLINIDKFCPHVGIVLNLEPDHLDWHQSTAEYYDAKFLMFKNQSKDDFAILNQDDPEIMNRAKEIFSKTKFFKGTKEAGSNPNWNACLKAAEAYRLSSRKVLRVLKEFQGIEHRLEKISSNDGRVYINDSKSTNISSLKWALQEMEKSVVLIMGGKNKGGNFREITDLLKNKTKHIILFGEAAKEIQTAVSSFEQVTMAASLREAIESAARFSAAGDTILFSPACASFDMFQNYEDRGRQFKKLVNEIAIKCHKTVSVS